MQAVPLLPTSSGLHLKREVSLCPSVSPGEEHLTQQEVEAVTPPLPTGSGL